MTISNLDQIQDDDLFACTDEDGVTKSVTGAQFKGLFETEMPWDDHDGAIFHIVNPTVELTPTQGVLYNMDGIEIPDRRIPVGTEAVLLTGTSSITLFAGYWIGTWEFGPLTDTSKVTLMDAMFLDCHEFNGDIGNWDVSNVTSMVEMFSMARDFNQDISGWDVSNVTDMSAMFRGVKEFNQDLSKWCVSQIRHEPSQFYSTAEWGVTPQWTLHPVWGTCP